MSRKSRLEQRLAGIRASVEPGALIGVRMGGFVEMFEDDACALSDVLGIDVVYAGSGVEEVAMCGFPAADEAAYVDLLARAGCRVVIVDGDVSTDTGNAEGVAAAIARVGGTDCYYGLAGFP
jgi:DNA mismatch repair ATPase MutS